MRVTIYTETGKVVTFQELGEGQVFGEMSAIERQPRVASVEAMEDVLLARLGDAEFLRLLEQYPGFNQAIMLRLCGMIRFLCGRIYEYNTMDVRQRIRRELCRLGRPDPEFPGGAVIDPAPTHADIASRLSTHREAVSRELSELKKAGIIDYRVGRIDILDLSRLQVTGDGRT